MSRFKNLDMLRRVDALLRVEDQRGTPDTLETGFVQPVIDIARAGRPQPLPFYLEQVEALDGLPGAFFTVFLPQFKRMANVLAAEAQVEFTGVPAAGNEIGHTWHLAPAPPNGSDVLVGVTGGSPYTTPIVTSANTSFYKLIMGAALQGGTGSDPWLGSMRGLLWGSSTFGEGGDALSLILHVAYFTSANVAQNFPAGTNLRIRVRGLEWPEGTLIQDVM